jgi:hypothetical protein
VLSFPRKRESRIASDWMAAFAGMTKDGAG